jgi:hypothetical protein
MSTNYQQCGTIIGDLLEKITQAQTSLSLILVRGGSLCLSVAYVPHSTVTPHPDSAIQHSWSEVKVLQLGALEESLADLKTSVEESISLVESLKKELESS